MNTGLVYDENKAGLAAPAEEVREKIMSISKGSKYFEQQQKRSTRADKQILQMKNKLKHTSESERHFAEMQVENYLQNLEKLRDYSKTYLHADLDSFFASCEALRDPSLVGTAFAVGGEIKHGVLSTTSYEARKFGVRSGMAVFIALQLCPHLKIVESHYELYKHYSSIVRKIFEKYDSHYISFGLDEASLDLSEHVKLDYEKAMDIAKNIQKEVFEQTKLTISCGIAITPQLAKIASDVNKPNGIFEIKHDRESTLDFISKLPIRKIPGIGGVAEQLLHGIGITTMKDVMDKKTDLWICMRPLFCQFIFSACLGINRQTFGVTRHQQSISKERTFDNTNDRVFMEEIIEKLCMEVCKLLQEMNVLCRNVTVKFKDSSFQTITRCLSFDHDTNKIADIFCACVKILNDELRSRYVKYRLLGVRCGQLSTPGAKRQISIQTMFKKCEKKQNESQFPKEDEEIEYFSQQCDEEEQEYECESMVEDNLDNKVVIESESSQQKIVVDNEEFISLEKEFANSQKEEETKNGTGKKQNSITLFDFFDKIKDTNSKIAVINPPKKKSEKKQKTTGFFKKKPTEKNPKPKQVQKQLPFAPN